MSQAGWGGGWIGGDVCLTKRCPYATHRHTETSWRKRQQQAVASGEAERSWWLGGGGAGAGGVVTVLGKFKGRCWVLAFAQMKSQESVIKKTNRNLLCFQYV